MASKSSQWELAEAFHKAVGLLDADTGAQNEENEENLIYLGLRAPSSSEETARILTMIAERASKIPSLFIVHTISIFSGMDSYTHSVKINRSYYVLFQLFYMAKNRILWE